MDDKIQIRKITVKDVVYLRLEDVNTMLLLFSETEEADVRNRLAELVRNLGKLKDTGNDSVTQT